MTWKTSKLGEVSSFIKRGISPKYIQEGGIRVLNQKCIRNHEINFELAKRHNFQTKKFSEDYFIKQGDVLINSTGQGTLGRVAQVKEEPDELTTVDSHITIVRPKKDLFFLEYFGYALIMIEKIIQDSGRGASGQTELAKSKLQYQLEISFPNSFKEQQRIVKKIDQLFLEIDEGIERFEKAKYQLQLFRQVLLKTAYEGKLTKNWRKKNNKKNSSFSEVVNLINKEQQNNYENKLSQWIDEFTLWLKKDKKGIKPLKPRKRKPLNEIGNEELAELPNLPETWGYIRFGEIIESIDAGKSFKCEEREPKNSEVGVAKVSAISWGEYDQSESKTCLDPKKINKKYIISEGDFIMSRANTIELVGAVVVVKQVTNSVMLSDKTLRIKMKKIYKPFLKNYLRSFTGRKEIMSRSTGNQDSMRNIGQDRIKSICIPICSIEEISELNQILDSKIATIDKQIKDIDSQLLKSKSLRQAILKKAYSGKLFDHENSKEIKNSSANKLVNIISSK